MQIGRDENKIRRMARSMRANKPLNSRSRSRRSPISDVCRAELPIDDQDTVSAIIWVRFCY